jgi:PAS domain S-box-containing protein
MLRNASEFISIYNADRELEYESPSIKRILGYDPEDEIHGMDEEFMSPPSYRKIVAMFDFLLQTPGGETTEQYTYLKKNGKKIFLETQGKNLLHDPAIRGLIFNTRDVTERERAKKEEKMKSRMQSLSENSPDIIIRTQTSGKVAYANPAAARFIGRSVADMMNRRIDELVENEDYMQFMLSSLKIVKRSREQEMAEIKIEGENGEQYLECKAIPEIEDDSVESVLFTAHDVTAIKLLEQEAQKAKEDVMGSINYAFRIQRAILPKQSVFREHFPTSFMFYRPKNIVSGDFPWFYQYENISFFAAVDCTGHGVPGALLSFIGYLLLSKIVEKDPTQTAAEILDKLHAEVRHTLRQDTDGANAGDGMDLALIRVDKDKKEMQYSGAHRPMYYMHMNKEGGFEEKFEEYEGTRKGIGGKPLPGGRKEKDFENHLINYEDGDRLYIFSDGLPDQLGGPEHKKFFTKQVKAWLSRNLESSMTDIKKDLVKDFYNWRGLKDGVRVDYSAYEDFEDHDKGDDEDKFKEKQVDDVLLLAIQL